MRVWAQILLLSTLPFIIVCEEEDDFTDDGSLQDVIRSGATYTIPSGVTHAGDPGVPWFVWLLALIFIMFVTFVSVLCFLRCSDNDAGDGSKLCYLCYSRVAASEWKIHRQGCMHENNEILNKMEVNKDAKCGLCRQGLRLWPASRASPFTCGNEDCNYFDKPVMTNIRYNCFPCDFDLCGKCASEPSELVKLAAQGRELLSPLVLAAEPIIMDNQSSAKPYPEPQVGVLVDLDSVDGETLIMDTRQATVAYPAQRNSLPNYPGVDSFQTPISPLAARNPRRGGSLRERSVPAQMTSTRQSFADRRHQGMDEPTVPYGCDTPNYAPVNDSNAMLSPYTSPPRRLSNFDPIPRHAMSPRHSNSPSRQSPMASPRQGGNFDGSAKQSPLRGENMRRHSPPMSLYHGDVLPRHTPPMSPRRTPPMSPPRGDMLQRHASPMSPPRDGILQRHASPMSPRRSMNVDITERHSSRSMNPGTGDRWSQQDQRVYGAAQISAGNLEEPDQIEADSSYPGMHCRRNPLYFNY